jgi:Bacterial TniB protein
MTRFPHLDLETAEQAELPPEERMARILEYRFCNYPAGDLVLDKLEILFYDEAPGRQLGLAILGESGLGKSYILKHFSENLHPKFRTRDRGMPVRPVVYLELPSEFKLGDLQEQVLAALGATATGWRGSNRDLHIKRLVKDLCVRMFIFDDIQHFTNQSPLRTSRLLDWIKYLLNDLEIAVVVAGIPSASEALHKDPQISTRFEPLTMPAWDVDEALGQFLGNFERTFPLLKPSNLQTPQMQDEILLSCNRTTRIMVRQLTDAAIFLRSTKESSASMPPYSMYEAHGQRNSQAQLNEHLWPSDECVWGLRWRWSIFRNSRIRYVALAEPKRALGPLNCLLDPAEPQPLRAVAQ